MSHKDLVIINGDWFTFAQVLETADPETLHIIQHMQNVLVHSAVAQTTSLRVNHLSLVLLDLKQYNLVLLNKKAKKYNLQCIKYGETSRQAIRKQNVHNYNVNCDDVKAQHAV